MNRRSALNRIFAFSFCLLILNFGIQSLWGAEKSCAVCGMEITPQAKNLIRFQSAHADHSEMHVCSMTCAKKIRKQKPELTQIQVINFNEPSEFLIGQDAYFLMKSKNIKKDMGANAMAPYLAAFKTEAEAQSAQKKYGDGEVVHGIESVLK